MIIFHLQQNSRTVLLIGCWLKIRMTSAQIVSHCDWNTTYWWNFAELQDAGLSLWFSVEQGTLRILRFMSSNQNNAETTYKKRVWQMKNRQKKKLLYRKLWKIPSGRQAVDGKMEMSVTYAWHEKKELMANELFLSCKVFNGTISSFFPSNFTEICLKDYSGDLLLHFT